MKRHPSERPATVHCRASCGAGEPHRARHLQNPAIFGLDQSCSGHPVGYGQRIRAETGPETFYDLFIHAFDQQYFVIFCCFVCSLTFDFCVVVSVESGEKQGYF